jgi:Right handed beta helix region
MKIIAAFAVGLALAGVLSVAPAQAQNTRSFVSGHGLDTNACTLAAPCRTLAAAFAATNAGGEIDVLDPAGYGALTINKAISIVNDGVGTAGVIVPSGGIGITINAGSNDAVSLRGLSIEGGGVGNTGIQFNTGKSLTVENCVIRHVKNAGIGFFPNATSNLAVSNTLVADNNGGDGIYVEPSSTSAVTVTAMFNHVELSNNSGNGIVLNGTTSIGTINTTVAESVAVHNGNTGFYIESIAGQAATTLMLFHSVAANNGTGLLVQGATIRVAQSMVTGNSVDGYSIGLGGVLDSYVDNYIDGNTGMQSAPTSIVRK